MNKSVKRKAINKLEAALDEINCAERLDLDLRAVVMALIVDVYNETFDDDFALAIRLYKDLCGTSVWDPFRSLFGDILEGGTAPKESGTVVWDVNAVLKAAAYLKELAARSTRDGDKVTLADAVNALEEMGAGADLFFDEPNVSSLECRQLLIKAAQELSDGFSWATDRRGGHYWAGVHYLLIDRLTS